jgi:hypothetical protein
MVNAGRPTGALYYAIYISSADRPKLFLKKLAEQVLGAP